MPRLIKIIRNILFLFIFATILVHFFPNISSIVVEKVKVTDEQLSNLLTSIDIILSTLLVLYSLLDQKSAEQRCIYDFEIVENSLSLQKYRRYTSNRKNTFTYLCEREDDNIDKPYYGMELDLEERALGSIGVPLCMKVSTKLTGKSIEFSDLRIYATGQEKKEITGRLAKGVKIEKPIEDGKEFLIRILLNCNDSMQKILLKSRIYLSFILTMTDDKEKKYNKYLFLTVQNIAMEKSEVLSIESNILSISSKSTWMSYIGKVLIQHFHFKA